MSALSNLCRFFTSTTGTGTLTVGAAVPGFLTPAHAGHSDGDVVYYAISDGVNSESGTGTFGGGLTTLTRSPVTSTGSGFNSAINLSGSGVQVFITPIASVVTLSGSLTAGKVPKASAASTLVDSNITIDGSGNVAIGGTTTISGHAIVSGGDICLDNTRIIYAKNTSGVLKTVLYGRWVNNDTYLDGGTGGLYLRTNDGTVTNIYLAPSGRVGINTTNPQALLDVGGGAISGVSNISGSANTSSYTVWGGGPAGVDGGYIQLWGSASAGAGQSIIGGTTIYFSINGIGDRGRINSTHMIAGAAGSGTDISFGASDPSTGAWIRNDGFNTVFSTNVGSLYLGYGGSIKNINFYSQSNQLGLWDSNGNLTVGSLGNLSRILATGAGGQTSLSFNTAGSLTDVITLDSQNTASGNGGAIMFSANSAVWRFAAIKGYVRDGGNNSRGDISFLVRPTSTDSTLTEVMRIDMIGQIFGFNSFIAVGNGPSGTHGMFRMVPNGSGTGYGSFWYNDGSNMFLLLTNNNDAFGAFNGLRPFYVEGSSGLVHMDNGATLASSASNGLRIRNSGGQNLFFYDDTQEHIEASTYLNINSISTAPTKIYGTLDVNSTVTVTGSIKATGGGGQLAFDDRTGTSPATWLWYATGGLARFWNNVNGDRITVASDGTTSFSNNILLPNATRLYGTTNGGLVKRSIGREADNNLYINADSSGYTVIQAGNDINLSPSGNLVLTAGQPFWSSGGPWVAVSDKRLKRDIRDYDVGLGEILQLRPISYKFNGRGPTQDDDRTHYGMVADEVQNVMPEMVGTTKQRLDPDDEDETDILTLHLAALPLALVNAVKELHNRLTNLEKRIH